MGCSPVKQHVFTTFNKGMEPRFCYMGFLQNISYVYYNGTATCVYLNGSNIQRPYV